MKNKKILSGLLAAALAFGTVAALPTGFADISLTASAASKTTKDGFVLDVDDDGDTYVSGYTGKGGAITIPKEAAYVDEKVFYGNTDITSVTFPKTCWYGVLEDAFAWSGVKKVVFEDDVAFVENYAFYGCGDLEEVVFKGDVYTEDYDDTNGCIGLSAFAKCGNLKKVTFSDKNAKVGCIGSSAFANCVKLSSINLPEGLMELYNSTFVNCFKLKSLTVPAKTKFVYYEGEGYHFGYAYDYESEEFVKMDGKTKTYASTFDGTAESYLPYTSDGVPVMYVTKGSDAEAYAKKYGIKYEYAKFAAPTGFKASKTANSVTLSWGAVPGADAYRVYIYNSETGKYEKYKNVTNAKCKPPRGLFFYPAEKYPVSRSSSECSRRQTATCSSTQSRAAR